MGLFDRFKKKPKWQHEDSDIRIEGIKELDDQKILVEIAKNDYDGNVRLEAVKKIDDESVLVDIAKNDEFRITKSYHVQTSATGYGGTKSVNEYFFPVRSEAIKKINDESLLQDIANNGGIGITCKEAINKINNKDILIDIITNGSSYASKFAIEKIDDESFLIDLINNEHIYYEVKEKAIKNINNKSVLENIAKNDNLYRSTRLEAIKKIDDEQVLNDLTPFLLKITDSAYAKQEELDIAVEKISDEKALAKICLYVNEYTGEKWHVAFGKAINKISDKDILDSISNGLENKSGSANEMLKKRFKELGYE